MVDVHPVHSSLGGRSRVPRNMECITLPDGMGDALTKIALAIFADCVNSAVPFQNAILAVYLSGLHHGSAITEEKENDVVLAPDWPAYAL